MTTTNMKYLEVKWIHAFEDEPILILMELDEADYEVRKIEIFRNGIKHFASQTEEFGSSRLSQEPTPSIEEIAKDSQFVPKEISKADFERYWLQRNP